MQIDQVSRTAQITAYSRGYHSLYDDPKIFNDFLANHLLTKEERVSIEERMMASLQMNNPACADGFSDTSTALRWIMQSQAAAPILLGRARYTEDLLSEAVTEGIGQYVILGAGLDTFAFRSQKLNKRIQVMEVDHPATQLYKRNRITELGWEPPDNLHFIPVDFTHDNLTEALRNSSFDPGIQSFFSWLGVTYYLSRETVFATLRHIVDIAPSGSRLVFDYLDNNAFEENKAAPRVLRMLKSVQELGEPMQFGFDPCLLEDELDSVGLQLVEDLSPNDIHERYFLGRIDFYRACEHAHFAHVRIK